MIQDELVTVQDGPPKILQGGHGISVAGDQQLVGCLNLSSCGLAGQRGQKIVPILPSKL